MNKSNLHIFLHRERFENQGFRGYSDAELASFAFGIRFAYVLCALVAIIGLMLTSIPILAVASLIAFLGVVLPRHPFDYIYIYIVRFWVDKPVIPKRTPQSKFACGIASLWLLFVIFLFSHEYFIVGYIAGGLLLSSAILVSVTDICIPSMIYNNIFKKENY